MGTGSSKSNQIGPNENSIKDLQITKKKITVYYEAAADISSTVRSEIRAIESKLNAIDKLYAFDWVSRKRKETKDKTETSTIVPQDRKVLVFLSDADIKDIKRILKPTENVKKSLKCLVIIDPKQSVDKSLEHLLQPESKHIVKYSKKTEIENISSRDKLEDFIKQDIIEKKVKIFCSKNISLQQEVSKFFKKKLKLKHDIDSESDRFGDKHVFIVCLERSRLLPDVKETVSKLLPKTSERYCILYLRHRELHTLDQEIFNSYNCFPKDGYLAKFGSVIDCVYNQNSVIYECDVNANAGRLIKKFLTKKKAATTCRALQLNKKKITVYYEAAGDISSTVRSKVQDLESKLNAIDKLYEFDWVSRKRKETKDKTETSTIVPQDQKVLVFLSNADINKTDIKRILQPTGNVKRSMKCLVIIDLNQSLDKSLERLLQQESKQIVKYSKKTEIEDISSIDQLEEFIKQDIIEKDVKIFCSQKISLQQEVSRFFETKLNLQHDIDSYFDRFNDKHVFVVCLERSLLIPDVQTTVCNLLPQLSERYCILYLRHRELHTLDQEIFNSYNCFPKDDYLAKFGCVIDCVCNKNSVIYECDVNANAGRLIQQFLKKKKAAHTCREPKHNDKQITLYIEANGKIKDVIRSEIQSVVEELNDSDYSYFFSEIRKFGLEKDKITLVCVDANQDTTPNTVLRQIGL